MIFKGLAEWPLAEQVVEVESAGRIFDLHNWASFLGFEYRLPETLILSFEYDLSEGHTTQGDAAGMAAVELCFEGVRDFHVDQIDLPQTFESETLSDLVYQCVKPGIATIEVVFMDGLRLRFEAGSVSFVRS